MTKPWQPYAQHILDAIAKVRRIQARGDLMQDEILYDATLRNVQTLSEATQQLPEYLRQRHPTIPWKQISGFRNILVHAYLGNIDPLTDREVFGFTPGAGGVNLRGAGLQYTLTLINGRRAANYGSGAGGTFGFANTQSIPLAAIERIEIEYRRGERWRSNAPLRD